MKEKYYFFDGKNYSKTEIQKLIKDHVERNKKNPDPRIFQTLRMLEGKEILDVGCSDGSILMLADQNLKIHGIDVLESSIEIAKEFYSAPNLTYEVRDLLKQPFSENSFDCVTFLETIEHVENPALYLREFYRILRPGGFVIISTPNATSLKNLLYALSYRRRKKREGIAMEISVEPKNTGTQIEHIYNWDFPTLVRLLDRCGFEYVDHAYARAGPIIIPILGKKTQIINANSKILRSFEPLMTTQIIKARKRSI